MTIQPLQLDPEVEGILREVAADPRSKLLRVRRPVSVRALIEDRPTVGVATAGLTTAERHLVQTYRAEVAYALVSASWFLLTEGSETPDLFSRQSKEGDEMSVPTRDSVNSALQSAWSSSPWAELGIGVGERGLETGRGTPAEAALSLCAMAQRMQPTVHAQVHTCAALIALPEYQAALRSVESVLAQPHDRWIRTIALTNLGLIHSRNGLLTESLDAYISATRLDPHYATATCSRLILALQLGDENEVAKSASLLSDSVDDEDVNGLRFVRHQQAHGDTSTFAVDVGRRSYLLRNASELARKVADV